MRWDWARFEQALVDGLVQAARTHTGPLYAAALDHVYRETDGVIAVPSLGLLAVGQDPAGWNPPDWDDYDDEWLGTGATAAWSDALTAEACRGTTRQWTATFDRYLRVLVRVCRRARAELRAAGAVGPEFVVLLLDDEHRESLLRRVLPARDLVRLFPEFDVAAAERTRVAALPVDEQVSHYVSLLGTVTGPIDGEEASRALVALGPAAQLALIERLGADGRAWEAAKLLADIGDPGADVIAALAAALPGRAGADQAWIGRALARLGRLDLVLDRAAELPVAVVVDAVVAPYLAFRDQTADAPPLDYRPLAAYLERWPEDTAAIAAELAPGRSLCTLRRHEVDEAIRGLSSSHGVIRRHAANVLGDRTLGGGVGLRVLPMLADVAAGDPDREVRRMASLSIGFWQRTS